MRARAAPRCPRVLRTLTLAAPPSCPVRAHARRPSLLPGPRSHRRPFFTQLYQRSLGANEGSDGKVPVIEDGEFVMCESTPVAAYVDETRGGSRLAGASAQDRAVLAIFASSAGEGVMKAFYPFLMAQTDEAREKGKAGFDTALGAMSDALRARGGPFVLGATPSLADTGVWPFYARAMVLLPHYRGWALPTGERFEPLQRWASAMGELPYVKSTAVAPSVWIEGYAHYANPK